MEINAQRGLTCPVSTEHEIEDPCQQCTSHILERQQEPRSIVVSEMNISRKISLQRNSLGDGMISMPTHGFSLKDQGLGPAEVT